MFNIELLFLMNNFIDKLRCILGFLFNREDIKLKIEVV